MAARFTVAAVVAASFDNFTPHRRGQQTSAIGHELLIKTHFNKTKTIILCLLFSFFLSVLLSFHFFFWFFTSSSRLAAAALKLSVRGLTLLLAAFAIFRFPPSSFPFVLSPMQTVKVATKCSMFDSVDRFISRTPSVRCYCQLLFKAFYSRYPWGRMDFKS